jgi:hypothetical protein
VALQCFASKQYGMMGEKESRDLYSVLLTKFASEERHRDAATRGNDDEILDKSAVILTESTALA